MPTIPTKFKLRQDTTANWTIINPVLQSGEPGWETDGKVMRMGDGVTPFMGLVRFTAVSDITEIENAVALRLQDDNAGPTAPTPTVAGMRWRDTSVTPPILRARNDANTAWVEFLALQGVTPTGLAVARAATALAARTAIGSPTTTISTANPSGGVNGDLWFQY